jgi:hypothetical protein
MYNEATPSFARRLMIRRSSLPFKPKSCATFPVPVMEEHKPHTQLVVEARNSKSPLQHSTLAISTPPPKRKPRISVFSAMPYPGSPDNINYWWHYHPEGHGRDTCERSCYSTLDSDRERKLILESRIVPLNSAAMSYAWGSSDRKHQVPCSSRARLVTQSCWDVLYRLQIKE